MEKLIKNVDKNTWDELKSEASLHKMRLAAFLSYLIKEHKKIERNKTDAWDHILKGKRSLTSKDASAMKNLLNIFEQEYGFE